VNKNKVIIIVDGGRVQNIFSSAPESEIEIEVIDYDAAPESTKKKEETFHYLVSKFPICLENECSL